MKEIKIFRREFLLNIYYNWYKKGDEIQRGDKAEMGLIPSTTYGSPSPQGMIHK